MSDNQMEKANNLFKENKFAEAGKIFRQLWEEGKNGYAANRYLYCLRKAGYPEAALKQGEKAYAEFPDNIYIQRELIWSHYEMLKKAREEESLPKVIQIASNILERKPEQMPLELTVFAVINLAKDRGQWQTVSDWCDRIERAKVSDDKPQIGDKKGKSNKEKWYFAKIKSLIELKSWHQARSIALEATNIYPKEMNFPRWAALALANLGKIQDGIDELNNLILKHREEWYILQDLSDLYLRINQLDLALRFACKAALAPGEDKAKVTLYQNIAKLALLMNKLEMAARHIQLSKAIRQQEKWAIKANLEQLESEIHQAFDDEKINWIDDHTNLNDLSQICRKYWVKESYQGLPRQKGYIESVAQDKPYGWIRAQDGQRVFFLQKELPKFLRKENLQVDFALEESWDNKKGKSSVKAVNIRVEK